MSINLNTNLLAWNHIAVRVRKIEDGIIWFKKAFNFDIQDQGIVEMKASGVKGKRCCICCGNSVVIELEQHDKADSSKTDQKGSSITHLSFSVCQIEEIYRHLLALGYVSEEQKIKDLKVVKILYFTGIDGVEIELIEKVI